MKFARTTFIFFLLCVFKFTSAQYDSSVIAPLQSDSLKANDTASLFIASISIYGNNKTKSFIIEREIPFKQGDYVARKDMQQKLKVAKEQLVNTSLFLDVSVNIQNQYGQYVFITVYVKERWYIFPLPYFSLVDKNLNTWWVTYNHSLQRANYGIKFLHNNFSGRNDKFALWLITGYTRQVSIKYQRPFFDAALHKGYNISFNYTRQRELNYTSNLSKQQFFKPDSLFFVRSGIIADADYVYRPGLRTIHIFSIGYITENVADTILKLNPGYLPQGRTKVAFPQFGYTLQYFHADYNAYPTKGFIGLATLSYHGFSSGINITQLQVTGSYTIPVLPKTQIQFKEGAVLSLPFNQPFFNKKIFGYGGIFMRGLEYYVIDGVAGGVGRATVQHKLAQFNVKLAAGKKQALDLPFTFYGKIYSDAGYVYDKNPTNSLLNNKMIYTWGFGFDMITFYDVVFKFDYSFNQFGKSGLFIHVRTDF